MANTSWMGSKMIIEIDVYATLSQESLYERGKEAGLSDEAANYLRYYTEAPLTLHVDKESGQVISVRLNERP